MEKVSQAGLLETGKRITSLYLFYISCIIVPLYMRNSYFQLMEAKSGIYIRLAVPGIVIGCLLSIASFFTEDWGGKTAGFPAGFRIRIGTLLLFAVMIWALVATRFSYDPKLSFSGAVGWSMGSLMTIVLVMGTLVLTRLRLEDSEWIWIPVIGINAIIFIILILQSAGMDPFGLLRQIAPPDRFAYLTTIGQKNSFAGYFCLLMPVFWCFYLSCKDRIHMALYGAFSLLGFFGMILSESDSVYAGCAAGAMFLLPYMFGTCRRAMRTASLLIMFGICSMIIGNCRVFHQKAAGMQDLSAAVLRIPCSAGIIAAGALICLLVHCLGKVNEEKGLRFLWITLEVLLCAAVVLWLFYTIRHFDDDWGTMRGKIWRVGWEAYGQFSVRQKMTGIGPEMLAVIYRPLRAETGINIVAAHNEPLQILLTQGAVGLLIYVLFWIYMLGCFCMTRVRRDDWEKGAVYFIPLASYFGQSLFCSAYPASAVLFSVMTAIFLQRIYKLRE